MLDLMGLENRFEGWLSKAIESNSSDLHLVCGYPPVLRMNGKLTPISDEEVLTKERMAVLLRAVLTEDHPAAH